MLNAEQVPCRPLFRAVRRQLEQNRHNRKTVKDDWQVYGSYIEEYDVDFRNVLDEGIVDIIRRKKSPIVFLDFMSPSTAIRSLAKELPGKLKLGLAISLLDKRSSQKKEKDTSLKIIQLPGDIMRTSTWVKIEKILGESKADIITLNAMFGWDYFPKDKSLIAILYARIWKLLSNNNGILLTDIPSFINKYEAEKQVEYLSENAVGCKLNYPHVKLVKTKNSPIDLSFLP